MPTAYIFTLRPLSAHGAPASLARATHAAVLRLVAAADPALAARIHDDEGLKPITVSNVLGMAARGPTATVSPDREYGLRVTLLAPEVEPIVARWTPAAIGTLDLDGQEWRVERVTIAATDHPWAGQASYEGLAASALGRRAGLGGRGWCEERFLLYS